MTSALLSKRVTGNEGIKSHKVMVTAVVVAIEVLIGFLALVTGFHVLFFLFGGILALLILLNPRIGAIMMLFCMPGVQYLTYDLGPVTLTALRAILIPTVIGLVLHILIHKPAIRIGPIGAAVIALIAVAVLSVLRSSNLGAGLIKLAFFLSLFMITFVLAQLLDDEKWVKIAIGTLVASSVILITLVLGEAYFAYKGVLTTLAGGHRLAAGATGKLYRTPHPLILDLNTYLPFVLLLAVGAARWKSALFVILASTFVIGIVLAAAMAGWLATIGSLAVFVLVGLARKQVKAVKGVLKKLVPVIVLGALMVCLAVPMGLLGERIKRFAAIVTMTDIHTQRTSEVRIPVWIAAKKMFYDHPILGVGLGSMPIEYHKYMVAKVGAPGKEFTHHGFNVFVDIGTEMGILGLGVFVWFLVAYARHVFKYIGLITDPFLANMLLAASAACVAVFIQMQTETGPFWANNFWCLLGLSLAIINLAKPKGHVISK